MSGNEEEKTGFEAIGARIEDLKDDGNDSDSIKSSCKLKTPDPIKIESPEKATTDDERTGDLNQGESKPQSQDHFARNFFLAVVGIIMLLVFVASHEGGHKSSSPPLESDAKTEKTSLSEKPYKEQCDILMEKKDWNMLIDLAFKWEQAEPKNPTPLIYKCLAYNNLHEYKYAVLDCKSALSLDSRLPDAYFLLGRAYVGLRDRDEALKVYKILEGADPTLSKKLYRSIRKSEMASKRSDNRESSKTITQNQEQRQGEPKYKVRESVDAEGNKHWTYTIENP